MAGERATCHQEEFNHPGFSITKDTVMIGDRPQNVAVLIIGADRKIQIRPVLASQLTAQPVATLGDIIGGYMTRFGITPVAALNGGMFVLAEYLSAPDRFYKNTVGRSRQGEPLGMTMVDGKIITPPIFGRAAMTCTKQGGVKLMTGITMADTEIIIGENRHIVPDLVNPDIATDQSLVRVYTPNYRTKCSPDREEHSLHVAVIGNRIVAVKPHGNLSIPINGYVIALPNTMENDDLPVPGKNIFYRLAQKNGSEEIQAALECGPMLVEDGRVVSLDQAELIKQGFAPWSPPLPRFNSIFHHFDKRAPRTVVGADELIATVFEGRQHDSPGVTLEEAGRIMDERYHCHTVIALDGGACSQLIAVNSPDKNDWQKMIRDGVTGGRRIVNFLMRSANSSLMRQTGIVPPHTLPETDGADRQISTALLFVPTQ